MSDQLSLLFYKHTQSHRARTQNDICALCVPHRQAEQIVPHSTSTELLHCVGLRMRFLAKRIGSLDEVGECSRRVRWMFSTHSVDVDLGSRCAAGNFPVRHSSSTPSRTYGTFDGKAVAVCWRSTQQPTANGYTHDGRSKWIHARSVCIVCMPRFHGYEDCRMSYFIICL